MTKQSTNSRFEALWGRNDAAVNGTDFNGAEIAAALQRFYNEAERHYHTMDHIDFCLGLFDKVRDQCANPDAVELAIWFHDAVYNFPIEENERLSAEYFWSVSEGHLPEELRQNIFDQVIATDHRQRPADNDQQILVDIDLSSFGRPWDQFIQDGKKVRLELAYLDDAEFYRGQIGFMKGLVERENFYNTPWFQKQFEAIARSNLSRYLEELGRQGYAVN